MIMSKTVFITGTSTGIGRACALHLDAIGYKVYAGVRRGEHAQALERDATERLKPILVDVADERSVLEAAGQISSETGGRLDGLINNAGVGLGGALEATPLNEIRRVMDVNVVGLLAVTKACLPMIRESRGRIINIGSTSGYLSIPGASVYSGSKFAVRAITDALRLELHHFGIKVILISPGAIESAIWDKGKKYREALHISLDTEIASLYDTLRRFGDSLYTDMQRIPAAEVADVAAIALAPRHPKRYYTVGKDARGAVKAALLPKAILDRIILGRIRRHAQQR